MSTGATDRTGLTREDLELIGAFGALHDAMASQPGIEVRRLLLQLEGQVIDRLRELQQQARFVAEANARSVELIEEQQAFARELQRQNAELELQSKRIEETRQDLERQARAIAEANVSAMIVAEESQREAEAVKQAKAELARRQEELDQQARALAQANVEAVLLVEEKEERLVELHRKTHDIERQCSELESMAFQDSLTGLFNHRYFKEQIDHEVARAIRYHRSLSVAFLDLDHFKAVNDTHGHAAGDAVLRDVGTLIRSILRRADITVRMTGRPFAVRYGGEEFVLILPETDLPGATVVAERVRKQVEGLVIQFSAQQPEIRVTISGGVACFAPGGAEDTRAFVSRADEALYRAKKNGRNRIELAPAPPEQATDNPGSRKPRIKAPAPAVGRDG